MSGLFPKELIQDTKLLSKYKDYYKHDCLHAYTYILAETAMKRVTAWTELGNITLLVDILKNSNCFEQI